MNFKLSSLFLLVGILFIVSCSKENIDKTETENPTNDPTVVLCNFDVSLEDRGGSLYARTIGGTDPFTYIWSTGETGARIINISNGEYHVTVTDAEGCIISKSITVDICDLSLIAVDIELIVNSDTTAYEYSAIVTGGFPPYSYSWNSGATGQTHPFTINPAYVTVTDSKGCPAINAIEIIDGPCIGKVEQINDTTLRADMSDGFPPYTYAWSTGETTETINIFDDGFYEVTLTDRVGCVGFGGININTDPCGGFRFAIFNQPYGTGTLNAVQQNRIGTEPFYYEWSTGETTESITVVDDGLYTVTVSDAMGCESISEINHKFNDPSCEGFRSYFSSSSGTLRIVPQNGTPPYTAEWSTGETTLEISVVVGNTYTVNVTDVNGCCLVNSKTIQ